MLVVSGDVDTTVGVNILPQVWTNGTWRDLTTAQVSTELYPFMLLAPDGRVFYAGPDIDLALPQHWWHRCLEEQSRRATVDFEAMAPPSCMSLARS